ncbi:ABC transporter substrate-binding protein [Paenibacillus radicis (ex Gao et al. 2016)]|uniref:Ferrichrome ABC transporter substrate-binding protein n=1 Tax=Paenibacillus radicis (ex Gao et al. 2016) TaxID=1737354 RepID=A0A917GPA5_9BACL|nr:ABC transporter substrate-binding protein [Paenibacillus radicis (ex Gao et al. 2016)]GGG53376.1 ferrichrome ABC transporter substrate-binding protein [Paenibacillus radicis (ex Gao et al. 2016)]
MFKVWSKNQKLWSMFTGVLVLAVLIAGCGNAGGNSNSKAEPQQPAEEKQEGGATYPMVVTDELGHEVTIPAKPTRIFAPILEDSLVSLGVKPVVQWSNGVRLQEYLQDQLSDVPVITFTNGVPPVSEAVLAYSPDLIILHNKNYSDNGIYEQYSKIAPTYVFKSATMDVSNSLQILGQILGEQEKAEEVLTGYAEKVKAAKEKLGAAIEGKKAAIIRFNSKGMFFMSSDYFGGYVLAHDLGLSQPELAKSGALEVSYEILPDLDADYIILVKDGHSGDSTLDELKASKLWNSNQAVKNGHVLETANEYWLTGGVIAQSKVVDDMVKFLAP